MKLSAGGVFAAILVVGLIAIGIYWAVSRAYERGKRDGEIVRVIEQQKERAEQERDEGTMVLEEARALQKSSVKLRERLRSNAEEIQGVRDRRGRDYDLSSLDARFRDMGY